MNPTDTLPGCTPQQALTALRDGALLLDVREHDEWLAGHVDGASHVPMQEVPAHVAELPRGRRIVCICRSGNRSGQVTAFLRRQGFDAVNMDGGMRAWAADQLPFVDANGDAGVVA